MSRRVTDCRNEFSDSLTARECNLACWSIEIIAETRSPRWEMPRSSRRCSQPRVNNNHNNNEIAAINNINNNDNDVCNDFQVEGIISERNKNNNDESDFTFSTTTGVASDRSAIRTTRPLSCSTGADPSHRSSSRAAAAATTDVDPHRSIPVLRHRSFLHLNQSILTDFHLRTSCTVAVLLVSLAAASLSELFLIVRHGGGVKPKFAGEHCRAKTNMSGLARTEQQLFSNLVGSV